VSRWTWGAALLAVGLCIASARARADDDPNAPAPLQPPPSHERVGTTPALGTGVPLDRVPANVEVVDRDVLDANPTAPLSDTLAQQLTSGSLTDTQGSRYNSTLNLRGYSASPVLGSPQGIAVYQDGQRVNDPFGDVVSWSAIPSFAVDRVEVTPGANPAFGLNALGGAAALRMKDGFSAPGARFTATGDSFGGVSGTAEYGASRDGVAFYGGISALHDHGWRDASPADVFQSYLSVGTRGERLDTGLSFSFADTDITGNGAAPVQLLAHDYSSIFTSPDQTGQRAFNVAGRLGWALGPETTLEGNAYFRHDTLRTANGDGADYGACTGAGGPPTSLCANPGEPDESLATDASGAPLPGSLDLTGLLNKTFTRTQSTGASVQLDDHRELFAGENVFLAGAVLDYGFTHYETHSLAGVLDEQRAVDSLGFSLGGDELNTKLRAQNRDVGVYFSEAAPLTAQLSLMLAGRLNLVQVGMTDLAGDALDGNHDYARFNPSVGVTYAWAAPLETYWSYGEANRAPTAAELACADPERPCRVPNAFTADPNLDQVVSRTVEAGARGRFFPSWGAPDDAVSVHWSAAFYTAWNHDDILFIASGPLVGSGYFANAGATRRMGVEASLVGRWNAGSWYVRYGWVLATFQSSLAILSPDHPDADANGEIHVSRGDRLPNLPEHVLRFGFAYPLTERWSAGVDGAWLSSRVYQGDESNQLREVPDYALVGVVSRYRFTPDLEASLRVENLAGSKYYTSGVLGDATGVFPNATDPRFLVPGRPRTFVLGLSARF